MAHRASVLIVAPSAYTLGGLATWLDYIEPGLRRRGWDVTVGLVEGPEDHRPQRYVAEHPHQQWVAIPCRTGTPEGRCRAICKAIRHVRPDLVMSVNIPDVYAAVARLRHRGDAIKMAMSLHGIQADLYDDIRSSNTLLDGVICTNRLACRLAERLGQIPSDRVHYAPCGTELVESIDRPVVKQRLAIAYVGRFEQEQKRILDIPPVLRALDHRSVPFELLIAGAGPDEERLRVELATWVATGAVEFLGRLKPESLADQVYRRADVFLLTSPCETGPIVVWEALAHGMAVVSSEYVGSGAEGTLRHEQNSLLFPVGDVEAAAEQLSRLWDQPHLRCEVGRNGHTVVSERYSIDASVDAWDDGMRRVLKAPRRENRALPSTPAACGRLDRWFGVGVGETVRQLLGATCPDSGPGGEWPHSYGSTRDDDPKFWRVAKEEDRRKRAVC